MFTRITKIVQARYEIFPISLYGRDYDMRDSLNVANVWDQLKTVYRVVLSVYFVPTLITSGYNQIDYSVLKVVILFIGLFLISVI